MGCKRIYLISNRTAFTYRAYDFLNKAGKVQISTRIEGINLLLICLDD